MQSTTEHNLGLITKKTQNLEDQLSQQIEYVRQLQRDKETSTNEVMELRARLEAVEKRATKISQDFDDATSTLKSLTSEYSKAQLLQKRYRNAVAEQTGFCKAFVCIKGDESNGGRVSVPGALVLADECTLNLPGRWQRSVVVDGAVACNSASSAADQLLPSSVDSSIGDVLSGYNASIITFGSQGALKNTLMFGESQQQQQHNNNSGSGLIQKSIRRLFSSLESNRVTHFSMRMSFGEVTAPDDQYKDLLSEYSNVLSIGRSPDVRCVPVQSEQEALSLVQLGLQRIGGAGTGNNNSSHNHHQQQQHSPNNQNFGSTNNNNHPSHKFVVLTIENFDTRGHFRKGTLLFVDVAAPPVLFTTAASSGGNTKLLLQQQLSGEQLWAQQSVSKLVESISYYASLSMNNNSNNSIQQQQQTFSQIFNQNHHHSPNNNNNNKPTCLENPSGLLLLLSESLGGNSRTSFISCLDATNIVENNNTNNSNGEIDASDNVVGTLNTALMMKNVRNSAMAFDVPAELQKLSMESENLAGVGN